MTIETIDQAQDFALATAVKCGIESAAQDMLIEHLESPVRICRRCDAMGVLIDKLCATCRREIEAELPERFDMCD